MTESTKVEPVVVKLESWEYTHASNVGMCRLAANWGKSDAKHYDRSRMEDDRTAQVAAAICEMAVAKHTNRYWSGHIWHKTEHHKYKDVPDVGRNIEVRRIRTGTSAAVRKHQLGQGLVLWVARVVPPDFFEVELYGWIRYDEAWEKGVPSKYAPDTTRVIDVSMLTLNGGK